MITPWLIICLNHRGFLFYFNEIFLQISIHANAGYVFFTLLLSQPVRNTNELFKVTWDSDYLSLLYLQLSSKSVREFESDIIIILCSDL